MIAHLKGILERKKPHAVVIDNAGIGYEVIIPLSTFYALPEKDEKVEIEYLSSPPLQDRVVILCDPMLATGSSMVLAWQALLHRGQPRHVHVVSVIASDADFAAMLVLQQWLSGGTGVNFMQEYGTSPVQPGSALDGQFDTLSTWFPPAAQPYLFSLQGTLPADADLQRAEQLIDQALQQVREGRLDAGAIETSKQRVLEELVYDLASHEHTAHQLAYYDGLDALDEWLDMVPNTKIFAFGGDYDLVEKVYGHLKLARLNVALVLAEKIRQGAYRRQEASMVARRLMRENADRFYGLGLDA